MKMSRIMAISLIFSLAVSPITVSAMQSGMDVQEQKKKTFWQRHKKKIWAGVAAALTIGIIIGGARHADKTMTALQDVGLSPNDEIFSEAVGVVGFLGPLGMERTISLMKYAINQGWINTQEAAILVVTVVGAALAKYWGVSHKIYIAKAGFGRVKISVENVKDGLSNAFNATKKAFRF